MSVRFTKTGLSILLLAGILLSGPLWGRDYEVELLVFERIDPPEGVEEQWNPGANSQLLNMENLTALASRADSPSEKPAVESTLTRMARQQSGLVSSGYRILYRAHWQQPSAVFQDAPVLLVGEPESRLQGAIRVYRTSLIFADISLGLGDFVEEPLVPLYFINEKRRLKFKEVHYFDHPRFGALLTVWPVEE